MKKALLGLAVVMLLCSGCVFQETTVAPTRGYVCFEVEPASADVYVDGKFVGRVNQYRQSCLEVPVGNHQIVVVKDGFEKWDQTIYVGVGRQVVRGKISKGKGPAKNVIIIKDKEKDKGPKPDKGPAFKLPNIFKDNQGQGAQSPKPDKPKEKITVIKPAPGSQGNQGGQGDQGKGKAKGKDKNKD